MNNFKTVLFELKYQGQSSSFDDIYNQLLDLKKRISVFITGITKTDTKFRNDKNIEFIRLDRTITLITDQSFEGCSSLTQITIPSSVTKIGSYAFELCSSLTQITIPSGIYTGNLGIKSSISITKI